MWGAPVPSKKKKPATTDLTTPTQETMDRHQEEYDAFVKSDWVQDAAKGLLADSARKRKKKVPTP